jgi:nucleotide-binding universal stress UspA family protein
MTPGDATLARIVLPLDGSELAERILVHVRRLLVRRDALVTFVRVVPKGEHPNAARNALERIVAALSEEGAQANARVVVGDPAEQILAVAEAQRASLIAMSTHGRGGLSRWIRGSTAERVLRASSIPLLLSNPLGLAEPRELAFRRILVPLDGSETAAQVLPLAASLGRLYDSELVLFYAYSAPVLADPLALPLALPSREEAEQLLRSFASRIEGVRTVVLRASPGSPAAAILDVAKAEGVDLIAMTTHGRSGVTRWALGSVAENVLRHAATPLLVVRLTQEVKVVTRDRTAAPHPVGGGR